MSNTKYNLRTITEQDYDFIYQVKKDAYQKYVEINFGEWKDELQKEFFKAFMEKFKEGARIITFQGKDIGFYNDCQTEYTYEIGNICILPEYQNQGIGTAILQDVLDAHIDKEIHLQYFKQNPVGRLYERLGFERVGETPYHYQMRKKFVV
ncbi:MAG: GNAT family N-acetyltransferase [Lachnospiraceae bacterium]|nr:GNAT family N-acetyltransferase [Lachnospiraceae bacterium]